MDVVRIDAIEPVFELVGRSRSGGIVWASALQDLDMAAAPAARAELTDLLSGSGNPGSVLVYLGAECFVDLHGLQVLLDVAGQVRRRGGDLAVVAPPRCLRVMVAMMGLETALPLAATAQHAARWGRDRGGTGRFLRLVGGSR